jgi:hypothetical protein
LLTKFQQVASNRKSAAEEVPSIATPTYTSLVKWTSEDESDLEGEKELLHQQSRVKAIKQCRRLRVSWRSPTLVFFLETLTLFYEKVVSPDSAHDRDDKNDLRRGNINHTRLPPLTPSPLPEGKIPRGLPEDCYNWPWLQEGVSGMCRDELRAKAADPIFGEPVDQYFPVSFVAAHEEHFTSTR